jgi:hypothetical protein
VNAEADVRLAVERIMCSRCPSAAQKKACDAEPENKANRMVTCMYGCWHNKVDDDAMLTFTNIDGETVAPFLYTPEPRGGDHR